jgi:YafQ family addiction module toxin component
MSCFETVAILAKDEPLPQRYFDHPLGGEWSDHRDCHIRPDLILIYRKPDDATLELVRLGSHSEFWPISNYAAVADKRRALRFRNRRSATTWAYPPSIVTVPVLPGAELTS